MERNPYTPPTPDTDDSHSVDEAYDSQPGRLRFLLPAYLLALCSATARQTWNRWVPVAFTERFTVQWFQTASYLTDISGAVIGCVIGALFGDKRTAKIVVFMFLGLALAAIVSTFYITARPPAALVLIAGVVGFSVLEVVIAGHVLRAVNTRATYISVILLSATYTAARFVANRSWQVGDETWIGAASSSGSCALGLVTAFGLLAPGSRRPSDADLATHERSSIALVVLVLGFFSGLLAIPIQFLPSSPLTKGLSESQFSFMHVPHKELLVPLIAFAIRWRPGPLVVAGIGLAAGGTLLGTFAHSSWPFTIAAAMFTWGGVAFFNVPSVVLVRQVVGPSRVAFWFGVQLLISRVTQMGAVFLVSVLNETPESFTISGSISGGLAMACCVTLFILLRRLDLASFKPAGGT